MLICENKKYRKSRDNLPKASLIQGLLLFLTAFIRAEKNDRFLLSKYL